MVYNSHIREGKHLHEAATPLNSSQSEKVEPQQNTTIEKMQQQTELRAQKLLHSALTRQLRIRGAE